MSAVKDSRVQFFNSESSFGGSSVLSISRLEFVNDQIFTDSQQIFLTLRNFLVPRQDLLDKSKLNQIIHRARLLSKQTIQDHLRHLPQQLRTPQHTKTIDKCLYRLQTLDKDYDNYQRGSIDYSYFYQIYGPQNNKSFAKNSGSKQIVYFPIQPDVVNIIQKPNKHKLSKGSGRQGRNIGEQTNNNSNKQVQQLQQQIILLKKNRKTLTTQYQNSQQQLRKQTDERVKRILKLFNQKDDNQSIKILKQQLVLSQTKLEQLYLKNDEDKKILSSLQKNNEELKHENKMLKQQIQSNRRLGDSKVSYEQANKSVFSQFDGTNDQNVRKLQKMLKNLKYQNNLLKNQLHKQRETLYKMKKNQNNQQSEQILRLKSKLQTTNKQLANVRIQLDRYKVQTIKLTDQLQKSLKSAQLAKLQAKKTQPQTVSSNGFNRTGQYLKDMSVSNVQVNNFHLSPLQNTNKLEESRANKYSISSYVGDGNQYSAYYQLLNKQFKIRFKRSCLRQKQLLYKANGLQIGVITNFISPNQIKVCLHLSNIGDQENIKKLKLRVTNAKNNKVTIDKPGFDVLEIGQQVKINVFVSVKYYPIGCTALLCEYQYCNKNEQVRVLLPAHIFKMVSIKPRDDQFRSPKTLKFISQKKISKDTNTLLSYLAGGKCSGEEISCTIIHEHTQTKLLCDIINKNNEIDIVYEHRSGQQQITQYFAKTIKFLLSKDNASG